MEDNYIEELARMHNEIATPMRELASASNDRVDEILLLRRAVVYMVRELCYRRTITEEFVRSMLRRTKLFASSKDPIIIVDTLRILKRFTSGGNDCIQIIMDEGLAEIIVQQLGHSKVDIKKEALNVIKNIMKGTHDQIDTLEHYFVLYYLPGLLSHHELDIRFDSLGVIKQIMQLRPKHIKSIVATGMISTIVKNLNHSDLRIQREALKVIFYFTLKGNFADMDVIITAGGLIFLYDLIHTGSKRMIVLILKIILKLLEYSEDLKEFVMDTITTSTALTKIYLLRDSKKTNNNLRKLSTQIIELLNK